VYFCQVINLEEVRKTIVLLIFFNLMLLSFTSLAQVVEPIRIELPASIDAPAYNLEVLKENGLLVFYESTELTEEGKRKWFFSLLDTNLHEKWLQYVPLSDGLAHHSTHSTQDQVIMLFVTPDAKKSSQPTYELLRFGIQNNHFVLFGGILPDKATIKDFAVSGNKVLIAVSLPKYNSDLLLYDLENGSLSSIQHGIEGQSVIQRIASSTVSNHFVVATKRFDNNRFSEDVFQIINNNGTIEKTWTYTNEMYYLHALAILTDGDERMIITGSYDNKERRRNLVKDFSNQPELTSQAIGVFFLRYEAGELQAQSYQDFESFSNIYKVLSTEELIKTRQRQSRSRQTKQENAIAFQFFKPEVIKTDQQFIYSAEAFNPQYRLETRMDYDFYGRLVPYTYNIFEGYRFFSALLASFDENGKFLWSSDFELRDVILPQLRSNVSIHTDSSMVAAVMVQNGLIHSKIIDNVGDQIGQTEQSRIESTFTSDRLLEEKYASINWWYDQFYMATGYQRISNNRLRTNNPRSVFYIQKLVFE
jgi:hypothetical protein